MRSLFILVALVGSLLPVGSASGAPKVFSDDFDRATLGSDWIVDSGVYEISGDTLSERSGQRYLTTQLRYIADTTDSSDQYGKLRIDTPQTHTFGFMFRAASSTGDHYEVHPQLGSGEWRWESYDPGYVERVTTCTTSEPLSAGDWVGATIQGTGPTTTVSVWRWDDDPDVGGAPNLSENWGLPDCVMTGAAATGFVDHGDHVGIRAFTGKSKRFGFVDDWSGGDVAAISSVCGDGLVEAAEQCDDGNVLPGDGCRANCTVEICPDGIVDPTEDCDDGNTTSGDGCRADCSAEICGDSILDPFESCDDGNLVSGDGCDDQCMIEAPVTCGNGVLEPELGETCDDGNIISNDGCRDNCTLEVCGDGILDFGEDCDDGNGAAGDGCRANCTIEVCGDGTLDPQEQCEVDADCSGNDSCSACACQMPGSTFSDDFDRASLGTDWVVDAGTFSVANDQLAETTGSRFTNTQMRYVAGETSTPNQFGKLQRTSPGDDSFGFIFRSPTSFGDHYEVHVQAGSSSWRWERYDPGFVERVAECSGTAPLSGGAWIGAAISGSGAATEVSVWRWAADPDLGGSVDVDANWGTPDCVMTPDSAISVFIDAGSQIGVRAYTGSKTTPAFADDWSGGDLSGGVAAVCGNGLLDAGEACDDGNLLNGDGCDDQCVVEQPATCGNGTLETGLGEECDDGNLNPGDGCRGDCTLEVCGDGILDPAEFCDDGNLASGDGCRSDCTTETCGDGILDPQEQCEMDTDCSVGQVCGGCACADPSAGLSDSFDGPGLGSDWVVEAGNYIVSGGTLIENSGSKYLATRLRFVGDTTPTPDQYGKMQIVSSGTHSFGFLFRGGPSPGDHYEVHLPAATREWRWERYDPDFVERMASCSGDVNVGNGDWIGAAIEGSGANTMVHVWRWDSDPDSGAVDILGNWGVPDCTLTSSGPTFVDSGNYLGIRAYTGSSTSPGSVDNWSAGGFDGDVEIGEPPMTGPVTVVLSQSAAGAKRDPDGIVLDSAGNVYVAACGRSDFTEGVWKVEPNGTVSKILGFDGDGVSPATCPVGVALDSQNNLYVATFLSDNVFKITPGGSITEIMDGGGAGPGAGLDAPIGVAVNSLDDVFITGHFSDNVLVVRASGAKEEILDATSGLDRPFGVAIDLSTDAAYVAGFDSNNVYEVTAGGLITEILDATGGGVAGGLAAPHGLAFDPFGNLFITGNASDNVLKLTPGGVVTEVLTPVGDSLGNGLDNPTCVATDSAGNIFVAGFYSENIFEVSPSGDVTLILDPSGDGAIPYRGPSDFCLAVDAAGNVFTTSTLSDTTFKIER